MTKDIPMEPSESKWRDWILNMVEFAICIVVLSIVSSFANDIGISGFLNLIVSIIPTYLAALAFEYYRDPVEVAKTFNKYLGRFIK